VKNLFVYLIYTKVVVANEKKGEINHSGS